MKRSRSSDRELKGIGRVSYVGKTKSFLLDLESGEKVLFRNKLVRKDIKFGNGDEFTYSAQYVPKPKYSCEWEATTVSPYSSKKDKRRRKRASREKQSATRGRSRTQERSAETRGSRSPKRDRTGTGRLWYVGPQCSLFEDNATGDHIFMYNTSYKSRTPPMREKMRIYYNAFFSPKYIRKHRLHTDWVARWVEAEESGSPPRSRSRRSRSPADKRRRVLPPRKREAQSWTRNSDSSSTSRQRKSSSESDSGSSSGSSCCSTCCSKGGCSSSDDSDGSFDRGDECDDQIPAKGRPKSTDQTDPKPDDLMDTSSECGGEDKPKESIAQNDQSLDGMDIFGDETVDDLETPA